MPCCGAYGGLLCEGCPIYDTPEGRRLLFGDDWEEGAEEAGADQPQPPDTTKTPRQARKGTGVDADHPRAGR